MKTGVKNLHAYQKSFTFAMTIFEISKSFPKEERYSLTDQIRRSSRSVSVNLSEGYAKRRYPAHFISKVSDADMELCETSNWLDFALACKYIDIETHADLIKQQEEIGKLLGYMIKYPGKFGLTTAVG